MALYKEMSDEALRTEYKSLRNLAHNSAAIAACGVGNNKKGAVQMGKLMRNIEIIEAIARQRGIKLVGV
jgi:hypothetical protein